LPGGAGEGYLIHCDQNSFQVLPPDEPEAYESDEGVVQFVMVNQFTGCPEGCRLYQPLWRARVNRLRAGFHPADWFERRPWQTQVALIGALVALPMLTLAIVFRVVTVKDLIALVRTIGEAWHGK